MQKIKIGVVGFGKIARDQHLPALAASSDFELIAITQGAQAPPDGVSVHESIDGLIAGSPGLEAVSLCTPPQGRHALARQAIDHRLHVILEKPPGQTLSEVEDLIVAARSAGVALFATWHSREAPAVEAARRRLAKAAIRRVVVSWREDVRRWHPGQSWIWQAGGFGVFDPGINALSIVTRVLPRMIFPTSARLSYPANRDTPIAAVLKLRDSAGTAIHADFDWRHTGTPSWDMVVETADFELHLSDGGGALAIDGEPVQLPAAAEYPNLYRRFAELIRERCIDADLAPLRLIADAFMLAQREVVEAFYD